MSSTKHHVAYLCSQVTIPGAEHRRADAFEHDRTMAAFRPAFDNLGMRLTEVSWDDREADWSQYDAAIIGTTWDYWDRSELFLQTLQEIESQTRLFNSSSLVRWNSDKNYLRDFLNSGVKLIPTVWIEDPKATAVEEAFEILQCEKMVLKRQVGAGAAGQYLLEVDEEIPQLSRPMMAQPFIESIQSTGELSMIFIDGQLSHGLIKRAKAGDYRIQSSFGGTEEAVSVSTAEQAAAKEVMGCLTETPLYARVDMLRADMLRADQGDDLYLMELELIEPYLYPLEGPQLGTRMAAALCRRLAG